MNRELEIWGKRIQLFEIDMWSYDENSVGHQTAGKGAAQNVFWNGLLDCPFVIGLVKNQMVLDCNNDYVHLIDINSPNILLKSCRYRDLTGIFEEEEETTMVSFRFCMKYWNNSYSYCCMNKESVYLNSF